VSGDEQPARLEAEVDARFLLANERTLLAWVRTALTLLAAGVAARQFGTGAGARTTVAVGLVGLGAVAAMTGAVRYVRADRALRVGALPATSRAGLVVAGAVAALALALSVALLTGVDR